MMYLETKEFTALDLRADVFAALRGKRIFLSGGTGFFGKWLLQSFLYANQIFALNASLTVLSRHPQSFLSRWPAFKEYPQLDFIQGDVRDFVFPLVPYDFIIHAANDAAQDATNLDRLNAVIVKGTARMLEFCKQAGAKRFMMISSGAVYGPQPPGVEQMPETYAVRPATVYGQAKRMAEGMCVAAGDRFGFSVLLPRCFSFVGAYLNLDGGFAVGNFIRDCLAHRPLVIKGNGRAWRSYLYAADLAEWLWTVLLRGEHARPYNVGSDQALTIKDLAYMVRESAGNSHPVEILGQVPSGNPLQRYIPCIQRAASELNLRPHCGLQEAIQRTLAWHKKEVCR